MFIRHPVLSYILVALSLVMTPAGVTAAADAYGGSSSFSQWLVSDRPASFLTPNDGCHTGLSAIQESGRREVIERGSAPSSAQSNAPRGGLRPVVIGEDMPGRVIPYAEKQGYTYYKGLANPERYTTTELLQHNRAQVQAWRAQGRPIYDVGPAPGRAFYPLETSPNYAMERNIARGYPGYETRTIPGEADWMAAASGY